MFKYFPATLKHHKVNAIILKGLSYPSLLLSD